MGGKNELSAHGMNRSYHSKPESGDSESETAAHGLSTLPIERAEEIDVERGGTTYKQKSQVKEALSAHRASTCTIDDEKTAFLRQKQRKGCNQVTPFSAILSQKRHRVQATCTSRMGWATEISTRIESMTAGVRAHKFSRN